MNNFGPVAQLVRAPPCHGGGRGFEPHPGRCYHFPDDNLLETAYNYIWGLSSAGRASALQAEGHRFEPCRSHFHKASNAGVAELADAQDLKSCGTYTPVSVRFRSPAYLKNFVGIAQLDRAFGYGPKGRGFESSCPRLILLESVNIALSPNGKALDSDSSISRFESW